MELNYVTVIVRIDHDKKNNFHVNCFKIWRFVCIGTGYLFYLLY